MVNARSLDTLQVEPVKQSLGGYEYLKRVKRERDRVGHILATVIGDASGGKMRVAISGEAKTARLAPTAKAVQNGDTVKVAIQGGQWVIIENLTWHEPPAVGPTPSTTIPGSAGTSSRSLPADADWPDTPPQSSPGTTVGSHTTWLNNLQAHLNRQNTWLLGLRTRLNQTKSAVADMQSTVNTNATHQNRTRDVATSTRDSVTGLRAGAIQDRVVSE